VRASRRELLAGAVTFLAGARGAAAAPTDDEKRKLAQAALTEALKVEQTSVVAYEAIANSGRLSARATALLRGLLADDREHAAQLVSALQAEGVTPPIPPRRATIRGLTAVHSDDAAARFAIVLEERAVGAYLAAIRNLSDANVLRTVAGAMGTDGQHLVVLRQAAGEVPVPRAFERGS
jgi:rubrerythrin